MVTSRKLVKKNNSLHTICRMIGCGGAALACLALCAESLEGHLFGKADAWIIWGTGVATLWAATVPNTWAGR